MTEPLVNALGGIDAVLEIPQSALKGWDGGFDDNDFKFFPSSVTYLPNTINTPLLVFRCQIFYPKLTEVFLVLKKKENAWMVDSTITTRRFSFAITFSALFFSPEEEARCNRVLFDKIARLVKGESIGPEKKFERDDKGNKVVPTDAYLTGDALEKYMELPVDTYEYKSLRRYSLLHKLVAEE